MKLSSLGEFGLIDQIRKMTFRRSPSVVIGMGDDAAALKISSAKNLLATTDMLLEGIHFDLSYTDFYSLGWKSAAVNLSDIAAMGGIPRFCLTSLGIHPSVSVEDIKDFYRGFIAVLRSQDVVLVGGDTCSARNDFVVNVMVLGEAGRTELRTRAEARPGDRIFVTGDLGDSAAGLEMLKAGAQHRGSAVKRLIHKHLRPEPRVEWGRKIVLSGCAHAMIDVSDGLSSDLFHICEQSRVGALIAAEKVPLSYQLCKSAVYLRNPPIHYALSGGEDYELLFTVPPGKIGKLQTLGLPLTEIGEITRTRKILIVDSQGKKKPFEPSGFDHFVRSQT